MVRAALSQRRCAMALPVRLRISLLPWSCVCTLGGPERRGDGARRVPTQWGVPLRSLGCLAPLSPRFSWSLGLIPRGGARGAHTRPRLRATSRRGGAGRAPRPGQGPWKGSVMGGRPALLSGTRLRPAGPSLTAGPG